MTVVDAATCAPLPQTAVDIWHCDALGVYSGYVAGGSTPDTTFLRGVQRNNTATRTLNARDGIYRNGGSSTLLTLTQAGGDLGKGVTGTVVLGIDPAATP
ncbi:hypothetical protein ACQPXS_40110 [Streptomyces sp. CA-142005]|uniref:hypothetical protein n=1 Tax=Streptomyces sp. CA-142005 TaxID=3240052 RepID=UPI003D8FEBC8